MLSESKYEIQDQNPDCQQLTSMLSGLMLISPPLQSAVLLITSNNTNFLSFQSDARSLGLLKTTIKVPLHWGEVCECADFIT